MLSPECRPGEPPYAYAGGDPINRIDPLGLMDEGRAYWLARYKLYQSAGVSSGELKTISQKLLNTPLGHSDLPGYGEFDWYAEDVEFKPVHWGDAAGAIGIITAPIAILEMTRHTQRHFRTIGEVEGDLEGIVSDCDKHQFEHVMHQGQDFFFHRAKGYKGRRGHAWATVGGVLFGKFRFWDTPPPDNGNLNCYEFYLATRWTDRWLKRWNACCEKIQSQATNFKPLWLKRDRP
ncbi:MAG: hypothetical protein V1809_12015 [Planctomycetota bacterium]